MKVQIVSAFSFWLHKESRPQRYLKQQSTLIMHLSDCQQLTLISLSVKIDEAAFYLQLKVLCFRHLQVEILFYDSFINMISE